MKRNPYPLLIALLAGLTCIPFVVGVATNAVWVQRFDATIVAAATAWRPPLLTKSLLVITTLGDPLSVVFLAACLAFAIGWTHRYRQAAFGAIAIAGLSACNHLLKGWLRRPRPFIADPHITPLTTASGYSFPSGHSSGAMLLYGGIILLTTLWSWRASRKYLVRFLCGALILVIGFSRIYVQVHYPSDVVVGYLSALCGLCLLWWLAWPPLAEEERRIDNT